MPTQEQLERLRAVVPYAQATQRRWHMPSSVTLAQWIFESSWGTSKLYVECNNAFGVKHLQRDHAEPYAVYPTKEFSGKGVQPHIENAMFVKYPTVAASFDAHGRLIGGSARYLQAISVADDVPAFCRALQACGYSTNPRYAALLLAVIQQLNLTQYDTLPVVTMPVRTQPA